MNVLFATASLFFCFDRAELLSAGTSGFIGMVGFNLEKAGVEDADAFGVEVIEMDLEGFLGTGGFSFDVERPKPDAFITEVSMPFKGFIIGLVN